MTPDPAPADAALHPIPGFPFNAPTPSAVSPREGEAELQTGPVVDRAAFDRLVLENLSAAQRFVIRLTGDADAAEEIVQTALVRAANGWKSFRGQSRFQTWLFQIVLNCFRDWLARRRADEQLPDVPDHSSSPAQMLEAEELERSIACAVSGLPPRQREVLVLHAYEQHSTAEIATVLRISEQNVRTTLHLARQRLKEQLAPYLDETRHEPPRSGIE